MNSSRTTKMRSRLLLLSAVAGMLSFPMSVSAMDREARETGRCDIPSTTSLFSRTAEKIPSDWVVKTTGPSRGSSLPAVMVDGWPARKAPADVLLQELMQESGLSYSGPGALPIVNWDGRVDSLDNVVSSLVTQFNGHFTFDGTNLTAFASAPPSKGSASFDLPKNRDLRLATLDILRAYDLNVSVSGNVVSLEGTPDEIREARKGLASASPITVVDVIFLRGRPESGRYDWASLGAVKSSPAGAGGIFVFSDPEPEALIQRLAAIGDLVEDSSQSVAAPSGWGLAVPPSQCGIGEGEIIVTTKNVADRINIKVAGAKLDADFADFVLGNTAVSVSKDPVNGWIRMVLLRPRTVTVSSH